MPNLMTINREIALADFDKAEIFLDLIEAGRSFTVRAGAVKFLLTATKEVGIHSSRRRFKVECWPCNVLVHGATTGPRQNIERHLREAHGDHSPVFSGTLCVGCTCGWRPTRDTNLLDAEDQLAEHMSTELEARPQSSLSYGNCDDEP